MQVKPLVQPTRGPSFQGDGPLHHGKPAITLRRKSRQMMPLRLRREQWRFHAESVAASGKKAASLNFS